MASLYQEKLCARLVDAEIGKDGSILTLARFRWYSGLLATIGDDEGAGQTDHRSGGSCDRVKNEFDRSQVSEPQLCCQ